MTDFEKLEAFVQDCFAELYVQTDTEEEEIKALIKMEEAFKRLADTIRNILSAGYMDMKNKPES